MTMSRRSVEAYALGQLDEAAARAVRAHLVDCARCAGVVQRLGEERRLFVRRAALPALAPPPFSAVLARAREGAASPKPRRLGLWTALAAAAALVIGVEVAGQRPGAPHDEAAAIVAEPAASGEACQDPIAIAKEAATREEHAYGACLTGTPNCAAASADPEDHANENGNEQGDGESCVTCESCGPHPGEDLDTSPRGDSAP